MKDNIPKGMAFEDCCLHLLQRLGFANLQLTKRSNDQGADLVGDLGKTKYVFQCKNHKKNRVTGRSNKQLQLGPFTSLTVVASSPRVTTRSRRFG
jgi:HJR/Mrr/RecB family endonuclease